MRRGPSGEIVLILALLHVSSEEAFSRNAFVSACKMYRCTLALTALFSL